MRTSFSLTTAAFASSSMRALHPTRAAQEAHPPRRPCKSRRRRRPTCRIHSTDRRRQQTSARRTRRREWEECRRRWRKLRQLITSLSFDLAPSRSACAPFFCLSQSLDPSQVASRIFFFSTTAVEGTLSIRRSVLIALATHRTTAGERAPAWRLRPRVSRFLCSRFRWFCSMSCNCRC